MRLRPFVAALLLPAALAACAGGRRARGGGAGSAVLEVRNSYLGAVNVFAVREGSGYRTRLGQVFSGRTERFVLSPSIVSTASGLAFIAIPAAASGAASTGVVAVRAGDVVQFNVGTDLRNSTVFVR